MVVSILIFLLYSFKTICNSTGKFKVSSIQKHAIDGSKKLAKYLNCFLYTYYVQNSTMKNPRTFNYTFRHLFFQHQ